MNEYRLEGFFINKSYKISNDPSGNGITLLARHGDMEIMIQPVMEGAGIWFVPAGDNSAIEFFFVHTGELYVEHEGDIITFEPGDSFYTQGLAQEIFMKAKKDSILIYVSSNPVFKLTSDFHEELTKLIMQINDKDNYTFRHSRNVLRYSLKLYERLKTFCTDDTDSNLAIAALFHDVGKIYIPDEILKKKSVLELNEYKKMMRHPIDSARLLGSHFNDRIVELAQGHHERLDGSGYPYGLTEEEISFEARILSVSDVFDAMTTDRGYNEVKSFRTAAEELVRLTDKFDRRITKALAQLVEEEAFGPDDFLEDRQELERLKDKGGREDKGGGSK